MAWHRPHAPVVDSCGYGIAGAAFMAAAKTTISWTRTGAAGLDFQLPSVSAFFDRSIKQIST